MTAEDLDAPVEQTDNAPSPDDGPQDLPQDPNVDFSLDSLDDEDDA